MKRSLTILAVILLIGGVFAYVKADSQGANPCGTASNDASNNGTSSWTNPTNACAQDTTYAVTNGLGCNAPVYDKEVRLIKNGLVTGNNNASSTQLSGTDFSAVYGSVTDLWGTIWTASDINSSTFGVAYSVYEQFGNAGAATSTYLSATSTGFSIPAGSTINGIVVTIIRHLSGGGGVCP